MEIGFTLNAEKREKSTKGSMRNLRNTQNAVPIVIYGGEEEAQLASTSVKDITKYINSLSTDGATLVQLAIQNGKNEVGVMREVQFHPVTDVPVHVDFQRVKQGEKIKISVKVKIINEDRCPGLKRGGVLNMVNRKIALYCNPEHIPNAIVVDISALEIGRSIHINDLNLSSALTPVDKSNFVILSVSGRASEEDKTGATAVAAAAS